MATVVFTSVNTLPPAVLAAPPAPGLVIENQATGSFVNPADGSVNPIESNVVRVTVAEVAGITLTPAGIQEAPASISNPGPNQNNGAFEAEDVVYFLFTATNVGNDPTQVFIPGAPAAITNGTQAGQLEIIQVDPDGPAGPTAPTDYTSAPVAIPPAGIRTGEATILGLPLGALPAEGTLTVRVPVKLDANLSAGQTASTILGDTNTNDNVAATQNQPYSASSLSNPPAGGFDLYTQDNQDTDGISGEANGAPVNGDPTFHRQEASALSTVTIDAVGAVDYGDAPDAGVGTAPGNYQTTAADTGAMHTIDSDLYIGVVPDGDDGTRHNILADADDTTLTADEGQISVPPLTENATSYSLSSISVTNNTSTSATLTAWIDFDQSGTFDADEVQTIAVSNAGSQTVSLTWSSLPTLTPGTTYARFRLTTDLLTHSGGPTDPDQRSIGVASDGEVEDYALTIQDSSVGNICANPLSAAFNTSNYALNTALQESTPLSFFGGTLIFNANLSGSATWANGVQVQNDTIVGDFLYLQPTNAPDYLNTNNEATYVLSFPSPVTDFTMIGSGLNNADGTTIIASYQGVQIPITAANFSSLSADMILVDADGDGQNDTVVGNSTQGETSVNTNLYTLTIPGPIDTLTIVSGKESSSTGTVTIGLHTFSYCLDPVVSNPNVLLVKRITAINGDSTNTNDPDNPVLLNQYEEDSSYPYDDNVLEGSASPPDTDQWPNTTANTASTFLIGARDGGITRPDDEIEYTIYFLSAGDRSAENVTFCDRIPDGQTFIPDAFNSSPPAPNGTIDEDRGIVVSTVGSTLSYTNIGGDDTARFYPPGSGLPLACNVLVSNTIHNGAIVVNLGNLPQATSPGSPADSYGYIRFRARVD